MFQRRPDTFPVETGTEHALNESLYRFIGVLNLFLGNDFDIVLCYFNRYFHSFATNKPRAKARIANKAALSPAFPEI